MCGRRMRSSDSPEHQQQQQRPPATSVPSCDRGLSSAPAVSPSPSKNCDHARHVALPVGEADGVESLDPESRLHVNPIFESVSYVKKKLFAKLKFRGFGHEDDDDLDDDDDAAQTKSLSIDSMYITPTNPEENEEKLIQATNYFIASALVASAVLAIVIVWLFMGRWHPSLDSRFASFTRMTHPSQPRVSWQARVPKPVSASLVRQIAS